MGATSRISVVLTKINVSRSIRLHQLGVIFTHEFKTMTPTWMVLSGLERSKEDMVTVLRSRGSFDL